MLVKQLKNVSGHCKNISNSVELNTHQKHTSFLLRKKRYIITSVWLDKCECILPTISS